MQPLLDIDQLAALLNVERSWVRDKVAARAIPFTKVGKHVRFAEHHVTEIIAAGEQPVAKAPTRLQVVAIRSPQAANPPSQPPRTPPPPSGPRTPPPPAGPKKANGQKEVNAA
jgi:excisionase family DNA binding protein